LAQFTRGHELIGESYSGLVFVLPVHNLYCGVGCSPFPQTAFPFLRVAESRTTRSVRSEDHDNLTHVGVGSDLVLAAKCCFHQETSMYGGPTGMDAFSRRLTHKQAEFCPEHYQSRSHIEA